MQRKVFLFILSMVCVASINAQPGISFKHIKTHVFDSKAINNAFPDAAFGGISAIEAISAADIKRFCESCPANEVSFLLFSDKRIGEKHNVFLMQRDFDIVNALDMYLIEDFEAARYNTANGIFCSSYETDSSTGIFSVNVLMDEMHNPLSMLNPTINRGIEGLTFAPDNSLWLALETGSPVCADKTVNFYKMPYDALARRFQEEAMITYQYPLDKCSCLDADAKTIDGANGNGVTDILTIKNMPGKLLVLERCFNKRTRRGSTYMYLATIDEANKTINKDKMLFDFNTIAFPNAGRNIEGMCWADDKTLLLVADDNFSSNQLGQVIELKMVRE